MKSGKGREYLDGLNPQQKMAVCHKPGPLLILAGAGSGKTRVLTTRIIHMVETGIRPESILAVTFTNKAAGEMKARVTDRISVPVAIGTFHSICLKILRQCAHHIAIHNNFVIYDEQDQLSVIKDCMKELEIDPKKVNPKQFRERISRAKDQLKTAEMAANDDSGFEDGLFISVYELYERKLRQCQALDFGDLIAKAVQLFSTVPAVLEEYRARFRHVLVDEYQDTNYAQYVFIHLLVKKHQSITAVGDPDQSIYEWRGASAENMFKFDKDFKDAHVIRLEQNYRSTNTILDAANAVIAHNTNRKPKNLWSEKGEGRLIELVRTENDRMEAAHLIDKILTLREEGTSLKDMVGFYRTHSQSRVFEEELRRYNIPYAIVGGVKFYARKEIKDLLAYLKLTYHAGDEVSLLRIINVPKRGIGKGAVDKLKSFARGRGAGLYAAVPAFLNENKLSARLKKGLAHFYEMIEGFKGAAGSDGLVGLVETIIETTGYVAELEQEKTVESKVRLENIREFYASVKEFEESLNDVEPSEMLAAYLEFISLQTDIDSWADKDEIFTLMTLHSAKGLEFPVVFMLGMEEGLLPHANSINASLRELEEERRLCYVGFTRAMERLYLSYATSRRMMGYTKRQYPSRFLYEIPPALLNRAVDDYSDSEYSDEDDGEYIEFFEDEGREYEYL